MSQKFATLPPNTTIVLSPSQMACDIAEETVVLETVSGQYFSLNPTGKHIITSLAAPMTIEALLASLMDVYNIPYEQCTAEVYPFLDALYKANLIQIRE